MLGWIWIVLKMKVWSFGFFSGVLGIVTVLCLKIENYCLKIFVKIVYEWKNMLKYVKYLKTKNNCLKT